LASLKSYIIASGRYALIALIITSGIFLLYQTLTARRKQAGLKKVAFFLLCLWYALFMICVMFFTSQRSSSWRPPDYFSLNPLTNIYDALANHDAVALLQIAMNFLLFLPLGAIAAHYLKGKRLYPFIPLFVFALSITIECLQVFSGISRGNTDDIILNILGALCGEGIYGLCKSYPQRLAPRILKTVLPLVAVAAVLLSYLLRPYGLLPCDLYRQGDMSSVEVDYSAIRDALPDSVTVYTCEKPGMSVKDAVGDILSAIGKGIGSVEHYDSFSIYYSDDFQDYVMYHSDGSFSITLTESLPLTREASNPYASVAALLSAAGYEIPEGGTREAIGENEYMMSFFMEQSGKYKYDGNVSFRLDENGLYSLDYNVFRLSVAAEEKAIGTEELADRLRHGSYIFSSGILSSGEKSRVSCLDISVAYMADSKGCYRPLYAIDVVIDGAAGHILLPAF